MADELKPISDEQLAELIEWCEPLPIRKEGVKQPRDSWQTLTQLLRELQQRRASPSASRIAELSDQLQASQCAESMNEDIIKAQKERIAELEAACAEANGMRDRMWTMNWELEAGLAEYEQEYEQDYPVSCARCRKTLMASEAVAEEGDEWECLPCNERENAREAAAICAAKGETK